MMPAFGTNYVWPYPDVTLGGALDKAMSFVIPNPGLGTKAIAIKAFLHGDGTAPLKSLHASGVSFFAIGLKR